MNISALALNEVGCLVTFYTIDVTEEEPHCDGSRNR
jgi:hypothetical protein